MVYSPRRGLQKGGFQKSGFGRYSPVPKFPPTSPSLQCYPGRRSYDVWQSWTLQEHIRKNFTKPHASRDFRKRAECHFESAVSEGELTESHWGVGQTRWVLRKTRWVRFGTQTIGWEELTELSPGTRWRRKNSLSSVFVGCYQRTSARKTPAISTRKCSCQSWQPMSNSWSTFS